MVAGVLVVLSLILQHGFTLEPAWVRSLHGLDLVLAVVLVGDLAGCLITTRKWRVALFQRRVEFVLLGVFLALLALRWLLAPALRETLLSFLHLRTDVELSFDLLQLYLLSSVSIHALRGIQKLIVRETRPEIILAGSFATMILLGGCLLLLPKSSARPEAPVSVRDAFFTATSAVCVTGLVVRDTGTDFSSFGQMVILVLIQIGGLGIITFVGLLSVLSARALPVPQMVVFRQLINAPKLSDVKRLIMGIVVVTLLVELAGAWLFYQFLPGTGDSLDRVKWAVFHSVSAFCNAGFAFQSDSLVAYQSNPGMVFTCMTLVVLGGLGFLVMLELAAFGFSRLGWFRNVALFRRLHMRRIRGRLTLQTQLALRVTVVLLVVGVAGFWVLEFNHLLKGRPVGDSFLIASFQSVTPRTAGFNTVPIEQLQDATLVFLMILMVIGASPMSMGGGIKTVSLGVLLLALRALVSQRERVELFGRCLPARVLSAALSVFVLYFGIAGLGIFLLALFDPGLALQDQAFEVISALSTVGLSTGITAKLSTASDVVLCLAMFIGRVGPLALVLSVFQRRALLTYDFPEEDVVVG